MSAATSVELDSSAALFAPGEVVTGSAAWELASLPERLELRLLWRTEGRGDADVVIVETVTLTPSQAGQSGFRFVLPAAPWSFKGPLIHLCWGIELVAEPAGEGARADFVLSPVGYEIELQPAPDPVREKVEQAAGKVRSFLTRRPG